MSRRYIEYRAGEILSLQDRILGLTDRLYSAHDLLIARGDAERAAQVMFDIYFLHGMRQMVDVLLKYPDHLYQYLQEETQAVEATLLNFIKESDHG